ncbi:MAG: hypothetical protein V2I62_14025 [Bacteroidales bacterium]|jgi:pimeloyl-ACP methyl ester carboxylesterase|nr:hypothetical protein [Bacteroidales bacterium]
MGIKSVLQLLLLSLLPILIPCLLWGCSTSGKSFTASDLEQLGISEKIVQIESRPGVKLRFLLIMPENPVASVILLPGGSGELKLRESFGKPQVNRIKDVYLVRNRYNYAKDGLIVALMDVPSDCKNSGEMGVRTKNGKLYKMSAEQTEDIRSVAAYLKQIDNRPVWVMGTSRGTISVANIGIRQTDGIDGLVFTSTLSSKDEKHKFLDEYPNAVLDMDLNKITLPVLVVAHRDDYCILSHSSDASVLKEKLINAKDTQVAYFTGGKKQKGSECGWYSPHGFYGIEERVDKQIAQFIKSKTDSAYPAPNFRSDYLSMLNHRSFNIENEKGQVVKIIVASPELPRGVFVMFRNGDGRLNIYETDDGPEIGYKFVLVSRCMDRLAKQGFAVAVVSSINEDRLRWHERSTQEYLKAIEPVFSFLKQEYNLPIWAVGNADGGFSAINAALHLPQVEALMLISPIDRSKIKSAKLPNGYKDLDLQAVRMPTLIIAHTKDSSGISGPRAAKNIASELVNSPLVTVDIFSEGKPNSSIGKKWGKIPHSFVGRSDIVVQSIVNFTELNLL